MMKTKLENLTKFDALADTSGGSVPASTPATTPAESSSTAVTPPATPPVQQSTTTNVPAQAAGETAVNKPTSANWLDKISNPELKDYATVKGFKDETMLLDSYKNLEKLIGVPKDQIVRKPDASVAPDAPEWGAVFEKLGKPADAAGYKIEAVQGGLPPEMLEQVKGMFHKANLTETQAKAVVDQWNALNAGQTAQAQAQLKAKIDADVADLKSTWGNAYDQNMAIAKAAHEEFGVKGEVIDAMAAQIGSKATMEFFKAVGAKLGEAKFKSGDGKSQGFGKMSPEAALAQVKAWKQDAAFMAKYSNKSSAEYKQMSEAMQDAYPGQMNI